MSGFMIFSNAKREQIKEENPGIVFTDIAKKAGDMWKALEDKTVSYFCSKKLFE